MRADGASRESATARRTGGGGGGDIGVSLGGGEGCGAGGGGDYLDNAMLQQLAATASQLASQPLIIPVGKRASTADLLSSMSAKPSALDGAKLGCATAEVMDGQPPGQFRENVGAAKAFGADVSSLGPAYMAEYGIVAAAWCQRRWRRRRRRRRRRRSRGRRRVFDEAPALADFRWFWCCLWENNPSITTAGHITRLLLSQGTQHSTLHFWPARDIEAQNGLGRGGSSSGSGRRNGSQSGSRNDGGSGRNSKNWAKKIERKSAGSSSAKLAFYG